MNKFVFFIVVLSPRIFGSENYSLEELNNSTGLYQEHLGSVHVSIDSWKFDIVINLSQFENDADRLLKVINSTKIQCEENKNKLGCQGVATELMQREIRLESKLKELFLIFSPKLRYKRDILDKVGSVAHALFGVMDANDAQKIYKTIDELTLDNKVVFEEIEKHRTTINSVVRAFNQTTEEINDNFKLIKIRMTELGQIIDETQRELHLTEIQTILFSQAYKLEQRILELIEIAHKAHDGIISGKLFYLPDFSKALSRLHTLSLQGVKFPFEFDTLHLKQLNAVSEVEGYYANNQVIISIMVPLTSNSFELFKSTSVPIPVGQNCYAVIENRFPFLATDSDNKEIILISQAQMDNCVEVVKRKYYCKHSFASYTDQSKNCIKEMIVHNRRQTLCPIKGFRTQGQLWEALASDNVWLYVIPESTQLHIICKDAREVVELKGVGILHLKSKCKAYTKEIQLTTVTRAVDLTSFTVKINDNVLTSYNFSSMVEVEVQGHINFQEVGHRVPLVPLPNSTLQRTRTMEMLSVQNERLELYEKIFIGIGIGILAAIVILTTYKSRDKLWKLLCTRTRSVQTDLSPELIEMLERAIPKSKENSSN